MLQRRTALELLSVSFATLLLELALIRWLPGKVRVIAYFPNVVLIGAFLGLGVGALLRYRRAAIVCGGLLAVIALAIGLSYVAFTAEGATEHLWLLYYDLPPDAPVSQNVVLPIALIFAAVALCFVPLGGEIACRIRSFQEAGQTLRGYAFDLGGSLLGVLGFMMLSATNARPVWWFAVAIAAVVPTLPRRRVQLGFFIVTAAAVVLVVHLTDHADRYSPYYAISLGNDGAVTTNGSLHQQMLDLRRKSTQSGIGLVRDGYRLPVSSLRQRPQRALVIGAGTGNDVAVLLDAGVPEVHAVEIDPAIIDIGRMLHPARPYSDPRVILHNTDARGFLEHTDLKFDLIVFGTLDSMTRLSALAKVRLDNFVYTVESLRAARSRLTETGGLALMFMASKRYIESHLFAVLYRAFGTPPLLLHQNFALFNVMFLAGPGFSHLATVPKFRDLELEAAAESLLAPDDSWPFLYLENRGLPPFYMKIAGVVLAIACALLLFTSPPLRRDILAGRVDYEMILFGAAFLLIETSFVTDMNLLFGATWRTSAVVFASILAALLIATVVTERRGIDPRLALAGVMISLVAVSFVPLRTLAPTGDIERVAFAAAVCGIPVLCAGIAFAGRFRLRPQADAAFGWNIVGAVIGGIVELLAMVVGLRAMFLMGALLYGLILWRCRGEQPIYAAEASACL